VQISIQNYAKHYLHPGIRRPFEVKDYFLKIAFLNKGIDFININSILKNKNVVKHIPQYFQTKEIPICYSYKNPLRNLIFIYGNVVSAYASSSSVNDCVNSKFCCKPHGHIITGHFDIVRHVS